MSGERSSVGQGDRAGGAVAERGTLEAHLAGCATCPPLYASLVAIRDALARDPHEQDPDSVIPPALATRIEALLGDV